MCIRDRDALLDLIAHVEAAAGGKTATIVGTKKAVRNLAPSVQEMCIRDSSRDSAKGKAIDKNVNALNALLGSMNLKPAQRKDEPDASIDGTPMGVWIRRWENEMPVPEPDPELRDVDGIVRYIEIWFKGHLSKMLGIKNSYSKMYEDKISEMRIERPEYEDEDDETLFNDIFSKNGNNSDE